MFVRKTCQGPAYSGSPLHRHERAVNVLVHGLKRWFLFPPGIINCDSDEQVYDWFCSMDFKAGATPLGERPYKGVRPIEFIQRPGDVVFIPSQSGHAVINLRESIGVAVELLKVLSQNIGSTQDLILGSNIFGSLW